MIEKYDSVLVSIKDESGIFLDALLKGIFISSNIPVNDDSDYNHLHVVMIVNSNQHITNEQLSDGAISNNCKIQLCRIVLFAKIYLNGQNKNGRKRHYIRNVRSWRKLSHLYRVRFKWSL